MHACRVAALVLAMLGLQLAPRTVEACSCPQGHPPLADRLADAQVVFRGTVIELGQDRGQVTGTMQVREWWKGVTTPQVKVDFGVGGFTCTPGDFHGPGTELLVFARAEGELLVPPACVQPLRILPTGPGHDDVIALGPGKPPPAAATPAAPEAVDRFPLVVLGVIAVIATIGIGVVVTTRRSKPS